MNAVQIRRSPSTSRRRGRLALVIVSQSYHDWSVEEICDMEPGVDNVETMEDLIINWNDSFEKEDEDALSGVLAAFDQALGAVVA